MNHMTVVRGGKPEIVTRLFGGGTPPPVSSDSSVAPSAQGVGHVARLARELLATIFLTPRRAERLFRRIRRQTRGYAAVPLERLDDHAVNGQLARFSRDLFDPRTLRRLHEIVSAQSRAYMILERLLSAWIPSKADRLLTQLMTGLGTLPNARLTYRLVALSTVARTEPRAESFLSRAAESATLRQYRAALAGTRFLAELDRLLQEFGHRGRFESDVMSPRFAEDPEPLLRVIQAYLRSTSVENPDRHEAERKRIRRAARDEVRLALRAGRSWSTFAQQWGLISIVCAALQRLLAQRDENRHVTTLLVAHLRRLALEIGRRAVRDGRLAAADDIFFVLWDELPAVLADGDRDWRSIVSERRQARGRDALIEAPDLLRGDEPVDGNELARSSEDDDLRLGLGVSPGTVIGIVKIVASPADLGDPRRRDRGHGRNRAEPGVDLPDRPGTRGGNGRHPEPRGNPRPRVRAAGGRQRQGRNANPARRRPHRAERDDGEDPCAGGGSSARWRSGRLVRLTIRGILVVAGLLSVTYLVVTTGATQIVNAIVTLSWRLAVVLLFFAVITTVLDTLAWRLAFDRIPSFRRLLWVRLAGEAVNTTTASVGGEAVKVYLLQPEIPPSRPRPRWSWARRGSRSRKSPSSASV
jgi:hypothetical protein